MNYSDYLSKKWIEHRKRIIFSAAGVFIFYLAANGFALFNYAPQHDALNYVNRFDGPWEIRLGRFLLPLYGKLRGEITIPWLIGLIAMFCLVMITYIVTDLLEIENPVFILLSSAILSANITHTELLSSFTYIEDVCMVSALLACMSVYILNRAQSTRWKLISPLFMVLSLGLYQAFISLAATLVLLLIMKKILESGQFHRRDLNKLIRFTAMFASAGIIYFLIKNITMNISGVNEATDYHSISNLLHDLKSLPFRIFEAFGSKFSMFFIRKEMNPGRIANCLLAAAAVLMVRQLFRRRKAGLKTRLIFFLLFIISAFTALMINIGAGMISYRLSFALFLYYLFLLSISELLCTASLQSKNKSLYYGVPGCLLCMVIWSNIVYSNGAYTIQKVIFDRSISLYTRVLDDMYEIPEYVHNQTPVIFVGDWNFDDYAYNFAKKEYRDLGTFLNTSVTYRQTAGNLMRYLGEDIQLVQNEKQIREISNKVKEMHTPSFPVKGYCLMVDDCLVINF